MGIAKLKMDPKDPVYTVQASKDDVDINKIMAKALRGQETTNIQRNPPIYGDFTQLPDLRTALQQVRDAETAFMRLDPFVRERFGNDPARMIDFLNDSKNRLEAISLGLVKAPDVPAEGDAKPKADGEPKV